MRFFTFLFCCTSLIWLFSGLRPVSGQSQYTISGYIRDAQTGEGLIGAGIIIPAAGSGAAANETGFYTISVPAGFYTVQYSFIGYETETRQLQVNQNIQLNISLKAASNELTEVVIESGANYKEAINSTQMSIEQISAREAKLLPALFGEVDIIKTLQLKPGVQSGGEGSSGLYVRGGGPDQNLFLLEDATVYNASHLFGFFSIFNPDAVKNVELYKGGFPAEFGGRLSSVVDVKLRDGNKEEYVASGGIGLISSRLTLEGPIQRDKSSFLLSGRRTYFDIFTRRYNELKEGQEDFNPIPDYYFYDMNLKANVELGEKDKLYVTGYFGRDIFGFNNKNFKFDFDWGNELGTVRWSHTFSPKLFLNTSVSATKYRYNIRNNVDIYSFTLSSDIRDYGIRTDLDYFYSEKHALRFGAQYTDHRFGVGRLQAGSSDGRVNFNSGSTYQAGEFGVYASDEYKASNLLTLNYGLRLSGFHNSGRLFAGLEPRVSAKYTLTENASFKASYTRMMQYIHLVSNTGASLPTDVWYPSNDLVKPQRSQQVALGYSQILGNGRFLFTNEVYYKWMRRQIDFRDGAQLFVNPDLDQEFVFGKGESYGTEFYIEKQKGKTTGWVGYTLSWTFRQFDEINNGKRFPTRYDRRHDLTAVVMHQLNKRINLTGSFVYGTGNAISLPESRIIMQDLPGNSPFVAPVYTERNSFRMAAYHRLDLGLVYKLRPKNGEADLTFSVYNAYNRMNPYFIYFEQIKDDAGKETLEFKAKQVSLFPVIPSITYNFRY